LALLDALLLQGLAFWKAWACSCPVMLYWWWRQALSCLERDCLLEMRQQQQQMQLLVHQMQQQQWTQPLQLSRANSWTEVAWTSSSSSGGGGWCGKQHSVAWVSFGSWQLCCVLLAVT
jgi:hypothetical protein